jgi:RimJ/RimL family protein N-acetyltransferase
LIVTDRLTLRQWRDDDLEPFAALNSDPAVMEFFLAPLTREQSDSLAERERAVIDERGWGLWAVENDAQEFIGFVGLSVPSFEAHFMPAVEIGWRLARRHWGKGYATEAARAVLAFGLEDLELDQIVSFTAEINVRSRRVMDRIGMTHDPADDFDHPRVADGPLRRHVLYRSS